MQQTETITAAMAAYPSLPASPTLTNPDMILPYGEYDSTNSPPYRSASSVDEWRGSDPATMQFSIGPPHTHLGTVMPTTPIIYGNGTMLSDIGEVTEAESTVGRKLPGPAERRLLKQAQGFPLRPSPVLGHNARKRTRPVAHERKVSTGSTSTITDDGPPPAELFKDFDDDGVSVDDSNFQGDDEESIADSYSEEVFAMETERLSRNQNGIDDDPNSSAALSRRAEEILQNAKRRLNNMEGNLSRARSPLYSTPSGSISSIHVTSPLSRSTPTPQNDRLTSPQLGMTPTANLQSHKPGESHSTSPGHSRVYSETSIASTPSVLRTAPFPVRSASAAAQYIGRNVTESSRVSPPLNKNAGTAREETKHSGVSPPLSKRSSPHGVHLEPLSERDTVPELEVDRTSMRSNLEEGYHDPTSEHIGLTRSTSSMQMRDLRDQMHDLKGRLSVLRDRARDDTMKRRSLQSLRTPSPFTAAEQWYSAAKSYAMPGLSADAGIGHSPLKDGFFEPREDTVDGNLHHAGQSAATPVPEYANSEATSAYEDVSEGYHATEDSASNHDPQTLDDGESFHTTAEDGDQEGPDNDYDDELDYESDASLYYDTTTISHEDREDAFDYEHFFLHSSMGTISQQALRRDSISSTDSAETTRGPPARPMNGENKRSESPRDPFGHLRSESAQSISTINTFATATEGLESENGDHEDHDYAVQHVSTKRLTFGSLSDGNRAPEEEQRPGSAIHNPQGRNGRNIHRPSVASFDSGSTGTTRSFPLVNKPKSQQQQSSNGTLDTRSNRSFSDSASLADSQRNGGHQSPVHMLEKEDRLLVEQLVASLGACVLGLQESRGSYEARSWRRRLDAARRILDGEARAL